MIDVARPYALERTPETLDKILEVIEKYNGVELKDLASILGISMFTFYKARKDLKHPAFAKELDELLRYNIQLMCNKAEGKLLALGEKHTLKSWETDANGEIVKVVEKEIDPSVQALGLYLSANAKKYRKVNPVFDEAVETNEKVVFSGDDDL